MEKKTLRYRYNRGGRVLGMGTAASGQPTVSIVITTFNHARYLADAIKSVLTQTIPPNEIIVVDDGSTDSPERIIQRYDGLVLIRQENRGLAAARNTGLQAAQGEFIGFLDADDTLSSKAIETNLRQFQDHPDAGFVYGAYRHIDGKGSHLHHVPFHSIGEDAFSAFLADNPVGMHATVLYRKESLEQVGGFDRSLSACEDYDAYLRLSRRYHVTGIPTHLANYRRHESNMSSNIPLMLRLVLRVLRRQKSFAMTRPEWRAAYRRGLAHWKRYYAGVQIGLLMQALRSRTNLIQQATATMQVTFLARAGMYEVAHARLSARRQIGRRVRFGALERTAPLGEDFGYARGRPVDRRYVESFLTDRAGDIRGRVLEVGDNTYTIQFGGGAVTESNVLNLHDGSPHTTFISDLTHGAGIPSNTFDCVILTQTLHLMFDLKSAVATLSRILRPSGVLLITVPWITPIDRDEWYENWCWSITPSALRRLLTDQFDSDKITVTQYGNVYSATAFLFGLAQHELRTELLDIHDPHCPVIVAARAWKAPTSEQ